MTMRFWDALLQELTAGHRAALMYVLHSEGSSPGRQGFKMFVSSSGCLGGSIGGGIMEFKLVEMCRANLLLQPFTPFVKRQIHRDDSPQDRSGMICSGEQVIAFYPVDQTMQDLVQDITGHIRNNEHGVLTLTEQGIGFASGQTGDTRYALQMTGQDKWMLTEDIMRRDQLHIIGAGHVSQALVRFAAQCGFGVFVYDDRNSLNTLPDPKEAYFIHLEDYARTGDFVPQGDHIYIVLMSFGYRTDKVILTTLLGHRCAYLGMMGSRNKVEELFRELKSEGYKVKDLARVRAPVGLQIRSRTPEEIAISVLAEIIPVRNRPAQ